MLLPCQYCQRTTFHQEIPDADASWLCLTCKTSHRNQLATLRVMRTDMEKIRKGVEDMAAEVTRMTDQIAKANKVIRGVKKDLEIRSQDGVVDVGAWVWLSICEYDAAYPQEKKR